MPPAAYRDHLERRHAALVFQCAECDRYLSRRVLLLHMTAHAAQYDAAAQEAARRARPDLPPPEPTPAQQLSATLRSLLPAPFGRDAAFKPVARAGSEDNAVVSTTTESPRNSPSIRSTSETPNATRAAPVSGSGHVSIPTPAANPVIVLSAQPDTTTSGPSSPAVATTSLPETIIAPTHARDEFSDNSDSENDFGPVLDSVFLAIEDAPAARPPPAGAERPGAELPGAASPAARKRERACPHCDKKYSAASSYFYHLKYFHKRSREHACSVCGARFGTRGTLREHARLHSGERALPCGRCGKRFRSKAGLYIHAQTHGAGKAWACAACGRAFRWRAQLRRHALRHAAARPHACPQPRCPRAFSVRADLLRHARTHRAARLPCPRAGCAAVLAQPRYLRAHLARKHPAADEQVDRMEKPPA